MQMQFESSDEDIIMVITFVTSPQLKAFWSN